MKGILAHKHKIKSGFISLFFGVILFFLFNSFQGALSSDVQLKQEEKPEPGLFSPNELMNLPNDVAQKQLNEQSLLGVNIPLRGSSSLRCGAVAQKFFASLRRYI